MYQRLSESESAQLFPDRRLICAWNQSALMDKCDSFHAIDKRDCLERWQGYEPVIRLIAIVCWSIMDDDGVEMR